MFTKKGYLIVLIILIIGVFSTTSFAIMLEHGDRGAKVKKTQELLSHFGYDLEIDGIYGYQTKEIVKDFQLNNGLNVDGIVGDNTFELIKKRAKNIKYTVKKGDTLSEIAQKYNSTINDICKLNNLSSNKIIIGQKLSIAKTGVGGGREQKIYASIIHKVQRGDTLSVLAKKYGTDIQTIKLANNLHSNIIYVGQNLRIPHLKSGANSPFHLTKGSIIWPVIGRLSSSFGWRTHPIKKTKEFHQGIDIAVPINTKIRAAAGGTIIQSGWISGFGKTIVIDHGQDIETLYGHNARLIVNSGNKVNVGDVIALSGNTGMSTGPHLHFGILVNKKPVNPLRYLP